MVSCLVCGPVSGQQDHTAGESPGPRGGGMCYTIQLFKLTRHSMVRSFTYYHLLCNNYYNRAAGQTAAVTHSEQLSLGPVMAVY